MSLSPFIFFASACNVVASVSTVALPPVEAADKRQAMSRRRLRHYRSIRYESGVIEHDDSIG
jgi:hypothetical protein